MFKVNKRNFRERYEIWLKLARKIPERGYDPVLASLFLILNIFLTFLKCFYYRLGTGDCLLGTLVLRNSASCIDYIFYESTEIRN